MLRKIKVRLYEVLVETEDNELVDRIVATFLMILIVMNGVAVVLETVEEISLHLQPLFDALETFSVAVFAVEYLLRLWIAPLDPRYAKPVTGRLRYALTPVAIIDLLAVLPVFLPLLFPFDLRMIRLLRIFRLFSLLKINRYADSLRMVDDVLRSKKEELLVIVMMISLLLLFSSSLMYVVENEAQPDKFTSIPAAMWWGVATLTTVGYGDVFPVTPLGKLLSGVIAFLGIGVFALPTGILASGFVEELKKRHTKKPTFACPHCGGELSSLDAERLTAQTTASD